MNYQPCSSDDHYSVRGNAVNSFNNDQSIYRSQSATNSQVSGNQFPISTVSADYSPVNCLEINQLHPESHHIFQHAAYSLYSLSDDQSRCKDTLSTTGSECLQT